MQSTMTQLQDHQTVRKADGGVMGDVPWALRVAALVCETHIGFLLILSADEGHSIQDRLKLAFRRH